MTTTAARPIVVFCDFDGTITEKDMVVSICEKFCPPTWREVVQQILDKKKSVKDGVAEMFAMIPSSKKQDIIDFAKHTMRPRAGLEEFLRFCKETGLLFTVCSGGIDFFVEPLVEKFRPWIHKIYSIPADFSGKMIKLLHPMSCETEGTCKVKAMNEFPGSIRILIGDSITDVHGAKHANRVFARAALRGYLDEEKVSYDSFETFFDVLKRLQQFGGPAHA
jgi:2-hydroxy-3-keto-5-methylthiopentenyl-1-phosphate phosphatase